MPCGMNVAAGKRLPQLEYLGDATPFVNQLHAMLPYSPLFENLSHDEVSEFAPFLQIYRAQAGHEVICEGDAGDFMLFVIEGRIEVFKKGFDHSPRLIAVVGAGKTLGEMSLIDGDPRSASCIADAATIMGVLTRENLARIILEQPILGAKILMELLVLLSRTLRETSAHLLAALDPGQRAGGAVEAEPGFV